MVRWGVAHSSSHGRRDVRHRNPGRSGSCDVVRPARLTADRVRASAHVPRRVSAKPEKLLVVMPSMHQMKRSPLWRGQRTQNRMV